VHDTSTGTDDVSEPSFKDLVSRDANGRASLKGTSTNRKGRANNKEKEVGSIINLKETAANNTLKGSVQNTLGDYSLDNV